MNNTPIYAINNNPLGAVQLGAVQYGKSTGLHSTVSQLPMYSGAMWDDLTPWKTRSEKRKEAEAAKAEEDAAYQEQLANIGAGFTPAETNKVTLAIVVLGMGIGLYFLSRSK